MPSLNERTAHGIRTDDSARVTITRKCYVCEPDKLCLACNGTGTVSLLLTFEDLVEILYPLFEGRLYVRDNPSTDNPGQVAEGMRRAAKYAQAQF